MNKFVLKITFLLMFLLSLQLNAQLSTEEVPIGFKYNFNKELMPVVIMPSIDTIQLQKEDDYEEQLGIPPRFGFIHSVDLNLLNVGYWHTLENGDKLCQLTISCLNALSINLLYDKFWLPEGAKLFIYNQNRRHHIGAFTEINNKGSKDNPEGFATGLVYGDTTILEYYLPKDCKENGIISIAGVVHGYRYVLRTYGYGNVPGTGFSNSSSCQVDINCSEGQNWQNEKRAVALILVDGNRYCTGSLINNTSNNYHPYFITADHCLGDYDAPATLNHWTFYWNYELPDCNNSNVEPISASTNGAKILANVDTFSYDFALLELTENPCSLYHYIPYYLGWDMSGNTRTPSYTRGVCIHHPMGDVKKIATYSSNPVSSNYASYITAYGADYWRVSFINTGFNHHSFPEGGSSGSPLINLATKKVIGLLGGSTNSKCVTASNNTSWFGKLALSWNLIKGWLDPNNIGVWEWNGISYVQNCYSIDVIGTQPSYRFVGCKTINVQDATVPVGATLELDATDRIIINSGVTVKTGGTLILNGPIIINYGYIVEEGAIFIVR